ncbi:hypothetical protein ACIA5D_13460 [Actinoplanes sp. NPDC051513]|uniref:hypothetical protein n=1 Tax=Actinoplanes sp. NPDC051513 TaxID=3363908 RepID=UPI00379BBEF5
MHWRTTHRRFAQWVEAGVMTAVHGGRIRGPRGGRADRLVARQHRQHARTGGQKGKTGYRRW